jgi:glyoxylase-like metal-dependent hydrolase (beta-lactamase superfamily II)
MSSIIDYEFGISAIDTGFPRPVYNAVHLIVENGRVAVVDSANNASVPLVLEALREKGLPPENVDYVILTHVHLDHSGGAGLLMQHFPNARLAVHPRGARHMADPSKLVAGTIAVYGEEWVRSMYGELVPVPAERIVETPDGKTIRLNGRELVFVDTPGHARHHVCVLDTKSGHVFAGDGFGVCYRELGYDGHNFVWPVTPPVQFNPDEMHQSLDRVLSCKPEAVYLTHFSQLREVSRLGADLHRLVDAHVAVARRERDRGPERHERIKAGLMKVLLDEADRYAWRMPRQEVAELFRGDVDLNAAGLGMWLDS